jgi:hypothetical protein
LERSSGHVAAHRDGSDIMDTCMQCGRVGAGRGTEIGR